MSYERHTLTVELLAEYLTFTPTTSQLIAFEADMRAFNPTLFRDAIREATYKNLAGISHSGQRQILHDIYTRKIKEFAYLYPVVFAVENSVRSALADFLGAHFGRIDWWAIVRDAIIRGQSHNDFKNQMIGTGPATVDFIKQAFFTLGNMLDAPGLASKILNGRNDEFYYCMTIGELSRLMVTDWTLIRGMFRTNAAIGFKLDIGNFRANMDLIKDARNELYHSNPISNRKAVFGACERMLNALDFHLADFDQDLGKIQLSRMSGSVARAARHYVPAR